MWRETNIAGVYVAPFLVYLFAAGVIWLPLSWLLERLRLDHWVWNPPLMEAALYVCILGALVAIF